MTLLSTKAVIGKQNPHHLWLHSFFSAAPHRLPGSPTPYSYRRAMINSYLRVACNNLQQIKICKILPLADILTTALFPKDSTEKAYAKEK